MIQKQKGRETNQKLRRLRALTLQLLAKSHDAAAASAPSNQQRMKKQRLKNATICSALMHSGGWIK